MLTRIRHNYSTNVNYVMFGKKEKIETDKYSSPPFTLMLPRPDRMVCFTGATLILTVPRGVDINVCGSIMLVPSAFTASYGRSTHTG